jgi:tetratricopeptide (TPR) repeat protein
LLRARAQAYMGRKSWNEAVSDYNQLLSAGPPLLADVRGRAEANSHRERWPEAIRDWEEAIRLQPRNWQLWEEKARAEASLEKRDDALRDFRKAAEGWATTHQMAQAIAAYGQVLKLQPEDHEARRARADLYVRTSSWAPAIEDWSQLLKRNPADAKLWQSRAEAYMALSQRDKALADFDEAIRRSGKDWRLYQARARCHGALKNWAAAAHDYGEALRLLPPDDYSRQSLMQSQAQSHVNARQWREAANVYSELVKLQPSNSTFVGELARACAELGEWPEAARLLAGAVNQPFASTWRYLALSRNSAGQFVEYQKIVRQMTERYKDAERPDALNLTAWVAVLYRDPGVSPEQSVEFAERAHRAFPANAAPYLNTLGVALYRSGRFDESIERLEESQQQYNALPLKSALKATGASTDITPEGVCLNLLFLAMAHKQLGHDAESRKCWDEAVQATQPYLKPPATGAITAAFTWNRIELELFVREAKDYLNDQDRKK